MSLDSPQQRYDADFHRVTADMNRSSAQVVVAEVMRLLSVSSVADFGCGQGVWLASWQVRRSMSELTR